MMTSMTRLAVVLFSIGLSLSVNAQVLSKEEALGKIKAQLKTAQIPAQMVMAIMGISSKLDANYSEDPNKPLKTMQGVMGISCVLAKKYDTTLTDENCVKQLHNSDYSITLGIKILTELYAKCNSEVECTLQKWYGNKMVAAEALGGYKILVVVFTTTSKK